MIRSKMARRRVRIGCGGKVKGGNGRVKGVKGGGRRSGRGREEGVGGKGDIKGCQVSFCPSVSPVTLGQGDTVL